MSGPARILIVGMMAAGKSTVARGLAHALHWRVLDLDAEIAARARSTIGEIFRTRGEAWFRLQEAELTAGLSSEEHVVIAPGGGWVMTPGFAAVRDAPGTCTVWLRVSPEEAVRRSLADDVERPMLAGADPVARAAALLEEREPLYATADLVIDANERTADAVVKDILKWLKTSTS